MSSVRPLQRLIRVFSRSLAPFIVNPLVLRHFPYRSETLLYSPFCYQVRVHTVVPRNESEVK